MRHLQSWDYIFVPIFKCSFLTEFVLASLLNVSKKNHVNDMELCVCSLCGAPNPLGHGAICGLTVRSWRRRSCLSAVAPVPSTGPGTMWVVGRSWMDE